MDLPCCLDGNAVIAAGIDDLLLLAKVARQEMRRMDVDLVAVARKIAGRLRAEEPDREVEVVIPEKLPAPAATRQSKPKGL